MHQATQDANGASRWQLFPVWEVGIPECSQDASFTRRPHKLFGDGHLQRVLAGVVGIFGVLLLKAVDKSSRPVVALALNAGLSTLATCRFLPIALYFDEHTYDQ